MIVHCPSCSTGYHLALPAPSAVLRCSQCREVVPPPAARRRYVLATAVPVAATPVATLLEPVSETVSEPVVAWVPEPVFPASLDTAPLPPPATPAMPALDAALFGSGAPEPSLSVRSSRARPRSSPAGAEPADATALVPLGLAAVGAAAAWFLAPGLAAWTAPLPFAVEPWMMGAAGAACGLLLGGMWVRWRAARR